MITILRSAEFILFIVVMIRTIAFSIFNIKDKNIKGGVMLIALALIILVLYLIIFFGTYT